MYYKLNSITDSISSIGERPTSAQADSSIMIDNRTNSSSMYIIIALIIGAIVSTYISSSGRKKQREFKKWNLENRDKLRKQ